MVNNYILAVDPKEYRVPGTRLSLIKKESTTKWVSDSGKHRRRDMWLVRCQCGTEKVVDIANIGKSVHSCGCLQRERASKARRKPEGYSALSTKICDYRKSAERRGLDFQLSRIECEQLFSGDCVYCGVTPSRTRNTGYSSITYNGIDRLDNDKGYVLDNCVSCCTICNTAKSNLTMEQFADRIKTWYETMQRVGLL